jgi:hypothetical protein
MLAVRWGKASKGGPPWRRSVCTVMPWAADVVAEYLADIRPRYGQDDHPALWLTERGGRISMSHINERFIAAAADALTDPDDTRLLRSCGTWRVLARQRRRRGGPTPSTVKNAQSMFGYAAGFL